MNIDLVKNLSLITKTNSNLFLLPRRNTKKELILNLQDYKFYDLIKQKRVQ